MGRRSRPIVAVLLALSSLGAWPAHGDDPPANDDLGNAVPVTVPSVITASTHGATLQEGEPTCEAIGSTVWYSFTPATQTIVVADTFASTFDTVLAVYEGSTFETLTLLECNDDEYVPGRNRSASRIGWIAQAGVTYSVQAGGFAARQGDLTLRLDVAGGISGRITDEAGAALRGICVYARATTTDGRRAWRCSDAAGAYVIPGLPAANYTASTLRQEGYLARWYDGADDAAAADTIAVQNGAITTGIDLVLLRGGRILGRVTDDRGAPVDAIAVDVHALGDDGSWGWVGSTCPDASGTYTVDGLDTGPHKVVFNRYRCDDDTRYRPYPTVWYDGAADEASADIVFVTAGQDTTGIDAALPTSRPDPPVIEIPSDGAITGSDPVVVAGKSFGDTRYVRVQVNGSPAATVDTELGTWEAQIGLPAGEHVATAHGFDRFHIDSGPSDAVRFAVDLEPPRSTLTEPDVIVLVVGGSVRFVGSAADDLGVAALELVLDRQVTGERLAIDVPCANCPRPSLDWTFDASVPPGVWQVRAVARDRLARSAASEPVTIVSL